MRQFLFGFPLKRAPAIICIGLEEPIPIRLEKNGRICLKPKLANKSLFSVKNCLCSGNIRLNLVRFVICLSTST